MSPTPVGWRKRWSTFARDVVYLWPWKILVFILRLLYGFHVNGIENLPRSGPFILVINEYSLIGILVSGWMAATTFAKMDSENSGNMMAYMLEEFWTNAYFREALTKRAPGLYAPLKPHGAGKLALNLLDGYQVLKDGGIICLNAEGDMPWDGRPLPLGSAVAWLALHTAAPIVPSICSVGAYDIWPRWAALPSLRGKLELTIGTPFKLCETPQELVSEADVKRANVRCRAEFDQIRYGVGGVAGWAGASLKDGRLLEPRDLLRMVAKPPVPREPRRSAPSLPVYRRNIAQLLWQCPVCHVDDALVSEHPLVRDRRVRCQACETLWTVRRQANKDFRLRVEAGAPDFLGVDMGLSAWYDLMKWGLQLRPIQVSGIKLAADEQAYLELDRVPLLPHRPNALFDKWDQREPPRVQGTGPRDRADWPTIGEGHVVVTNQRLIWCNTERELNFNWSSVSAIYLWLINTLGIRYGMASYRFRLQQQVGLKWLAYVGTLAQRAAAQDGHKLTVSRF